MGDAVSATDNTMFPQFERRALEALHDNFAAFSSGN